MKPIHPISFLACTIVIEPSGECEVLKTISRIICNLLPHVRKLTFSWEDPSLCTNLPAILAEIDEEKIPFYIKTSGIWSLPDKILQTLSSCSCFSMLIITDFDERVLKDEDEYSRKLFTNMEYANSLGIPLKTETPVNEQTDSHLEEILEKACLWGASEVSIRRDPNAFGSDLAKYQERYFQIFSRMETFLKEGWPLSANECVPICASKLLFHFCGAGITSCHIDRKGDIYACQHSEERLGNIIDTPLHQVYLSPQIKKWREHIIDECSSCNFFAECMGGCRFLGKPFGIKTDPLCHHDKVPWRKKYLQPIKLSEKLHIIPHFELRKSDEALVVSSGKKFLVFPKKTTKLFQFLHSEPSLRTIAEIPDSLNIIFQLYERGFLSLMRKGPLEYKIPERTEEQAGNEKAVNFPVINFQENLLLRLASGLKLAHKGHKVLVVHPESASWCFVNFSDFYCIQSLSEPTYASDFMRENSWIPKEMIKEMLDYFYQKGIIEINGTNFWNYSDMWNNDNSGPIQFIIKTRGPEGEIIEMETMRKIIKNIDIHFHNDENIIELQLEGETQESWLTQFLEEIEQCMLGEKTYLKTFFSTIDISDQLIELLGKWHATIEIEVHRDFPDITSLAGKAQESNVIIIVQIKAETPEEMKDLLGRIRDKGIFAVRLVPLYDYDSPHTIRKWGSAFLEILEETIDDKNNQRVLIKELDSFLRNLLSKTRPHPCYRHPCGAGTQRLAFDWKGNLYPCVKMIPDKKFNCGSISCDISPRKIIADNAEIKKYLYAGWTVRCRECKWRNFCPVCCPAEMHINRPDRRCGLYKYLFEELCMRISKNPAIIKNICPSCVF